MTKRPKVRHAHDLYSKSLLTHVEVAKQFLQRFVDPELLSRMDLNSLILSPNSYVDSRLQARQKDVLYHCQLEGQACMVYILIEHQSRPDKFMPIRMLNYLSHIWLNEVKTNKPDKVSFVIPIVLYNGDKPYPYPTSLNDIIDAPADVVGKQFDHIFQLVDLNMIEDAVLRSEKWLDISLYFMKNIRVRNIMKRLEEMKDVMIVAEQRHGVDFIVALYHYIMSKADSSAHEMQQFFMKHFSDRTKEVVMTGAEQLINQSIQQGIEQGIRMGMEQGVEQGIEQGMVRGMEQGIEEGEHRALLKRNLELVKNMRNLHYEPEIIAKVANLTLSEVRCLLEM